MASFIHSFIHSISGVMSLSDGRTDERLRIMNITYQACMLRDGDFGPWTEINRRIVIGMLRRQKFVELGTRYRGSRSYESQDSSLIILMDYDLQI